MSSEFVLTSENYHGSEANWKYVSASQYKDFCGTISKLGCEACAMAKLRGEFADVETTALLVGSYVDAYFEGTLATFAAQHPEIYSSRGKTAGELKSEYKQATIMIDRAVRDPLFMQFMEGQKQVIMTGEIEGVPVKIKIDSFDGIRITDLKTVRSITETFYAKDLGQRLNFVENWGYDIQGAIYREIVHGKPCRRSHSKGVRRRTVRCSASTKLLKFCLSGIRCPPPAFRAVRASMTCSPFQYWYISNFHSPPVVTAGGFQCSAALAVVSILVVFILVVFIHYHFQCLHSCSTLCLTAYSPVP